MPDTSAPTQARYPSRKALREQRARQEQRSEQEILLPNVPHVPHLTVEQEAPACAPRTLRRKLAGVAAAGSVGAMVLALSLPVTENARFAEPAVAAQQRLFSSVDAPLDELPASLADISAVEIEDTKPTSFAPNPEMVVNYPIYASVTLTDTFGYRTAPVEQFHDAQDFAAAAGTQIQAIADGKVVEAGFASDGCGFALKLEHEIDGKEVTSRYCHMQVDSHSLSLGDEVKMGDPAGRVGNTGMSFGAHLHLALVVDKVPTDPMPFLSKYSRVKR